MAFRVGQKVVCVDDRNGSLDYSDPFGPGYAYGLRKGAVYTVAGICANFLDIAEVANPLSAVGWFASRFRPAVERKTETDISVFQKMLTGSPVRERV